MKLKNQLKSKGSTNGVQKGNIGKKQKNEAPAKVVKAAVAKNTKQLKEAVVKNNKNQKTPKKTLPPKKVIEEDDDDDEDEDDDEMEQEELEESSENGEDSGADVEADADDVASDMEEDSDGDDDELAEEDEESDENDEEVEAEGQENESSDDDDDHDEEDDEDDDDDDGPSEEPIVKKSKEQKTPKQIGIPKIKCGEVGKDIPNNQVIVVRKLPKKGQFKQVDLVEVFGKYGTLHTIKPIYYKDAPSVAHIAFTTSEAAKAALAANKTEINGSTIQVLPRPESKTMKLKAEKINKYEEEAEKKRQFDATGDRTIFIKNLNPETSEEFLQEHFESFGEIETIKLVPRKLWPYAFITYVEASSANAALKLHNSVLNNSTIRVFLNGDQKSKYMNKKPECTVLLKNTQQLKSIPGDKIEKIFKKCGEIESIDVICSKNVLAFVVFKNEESVPKALAMNEKTVDDLTLDLMEYKEKPNTNTTVFMINVKPGVSEEEIRAFFAETGEIESVFLKIGFAFVKFANTDGFCKSFLMNERKLAGQTVFLEPYSAEKKKLSNKRKQFTQQSQKRKFPQNKNFASKKPKLNKE